MYNMHDDHYHIGAGISAAAAAATYHRKRPRRAKQKILRDQLGVQSRSTCGSVFFGNCTQWGPNAKRYVESELASEVETPWDVFSMAEHHLDANNRGKLIKTFGKLGYKTGMTNATATGRSVHGTSGGVCISIPTNRAATLRDSTCTIKDTGVPMHGRDWIVTILHRRGVDIAYGAAYFECGGFTVTNRTRAMEIGTTFRCLGLPFILAADYNMPPEEAVASGLAGLIGGTVRTVNNAPFTCTAGESGRVLDYWIVSDDAQWLMTNLRLITRVTWKPHYGIAFDIVALATLITGTMIKKPIKILGPIHATCDANKLTACSDIQ